MHLSFSGVSRSSRQSTAVSHLNVHLCCFLVNLAGGMRLRSGLFLRGTIRNLFDTAYIHLREYPVPGREFLLESGMEF